MWWWLNYWRMGGSKLFMYEILGPRFSVLEDTVVLFPFCCGSFMGQCNEVAQSTFVEIEDSFFICNLRVREEEGLEWKWPFNIIPMFGSDPLVRIASARWHTFVVLVILACFLLLLLRIVIFIWDLIFFFLQLCHVANPSATSSWPQMCVFDSRQATQNESMEY